MSYAHSPHAGEYTRHLPVASAEIKLSAWLGAISLRVKLIVGLAILFGAVWLAFGSREELDFTFGLLTASLAPGLVCYLVLAYTTERIRSRPERRFVTVTAAVMAISWLLAVLVFSEPIVHTALRPGPAQRLTTSWISLADKREVLAFVVRADSLLIGIGTALLLVGRASWADRRSRLRDHPMAAMALAQLGLLVAFVLAEALDAPSNAAIRTAYVAAATALPVGAVIGLASQRLSPGRVLTRLSDQKDCKEASGRSSALWLERQRLATELASSERSLEAVRAQLAMSAAEERRRIQRDLHDGAQQHLIGMQMKVELALEAMQEDRGRSAALLTEIGDELGGTASDLRSLAADVFPPTLREHGLLDALRSAIGRMGLDVSVQAYGLSRHPGDVETQLYFVCLEALQNMSKHGGPNVTATLRLWEVKRRLYLELRDTGPGFDPERVDTGSGLSNMRARLYAIRGRLTVASSNGGGTVVRAIVPLRRPVNGALGERVGAASDRTRHARAM